MVTARCGCSGVVQVVLVLGPPALHMKLKRHGGSSPGSTCKLCLFFTLLIVEPVATRGVIAACGTTAREHVDEIAVTSTRALADVVAPDDYERACIRTLSSLFRRNSVSALDAIAEASRKPTNGPLVQAVCKRVSSLMFIFRSRPKSPAAA